MNKELQQDAIAEACGWKKGIIQRYYGRPDEILPYGWTPPEGWFNSNSIFAKAYRNDRESGMLSPPDYLNDLNAMHEAESLNLRSLNAVERYRVVLREVLAAKFATESDITACAAHRAETFLRFFNLWVD